jgi:hypothetical protein
VHARVRRATRTGSLGLINVRRKVTLRLSGQTTMPEDVEEMSQASSDIIAWSRHPDLYQFHIFGFGQSLTPTAPTTAVDPRGAAAPADVRGSRKACRSRPWGRAPPASSLEGLRSAPPSGFVAGVQNGR